MIKFIDLLGDIWMHSIECPQGIYRKCYSKKGFFLLSKNVFAIGIKFVIIQTLVSSNLIDVIQLQVK